jgi:hypothetical protein
MVKSGGPMSPDEGTYFGLPGMPGAGIPRPLQQCRHLSPGRKGRALVVPPPLQPFVSPGSNDVAASLYIYLSPELVPTGQSIVPPSVALAEAAVQPPHHLDVDDCSEDALVHQDMDKPPAEKSKAPRQASPPLESSTRAQQEHVVGNSPFGVPRGLGEDSTATQNSSQQAAGGESSSGLKVGSSSEKYPEHVNCVPEWYQRGQSVANLLEAAESLDWVVSGL